MQKVFFTSIYLILISCSSDRLHTLTAANAQCDSVRISENKSENDTSKIILINSVVFDTLASLIHGQVIDGKSFRVIQNAQVKLFNKDEEINIETDSIGEFELFQNLSPEIWFLSIQHRDYKCMKVENVISQGGQWYTIKLNRK